jgi:hypothetical protein
MAEYAGPLIIYLLFYIRPSFIYGSSANSKPVHLAAQFVFLFIEIKSLKIVLVWVLLVGHFIMQNVSLKRYLFIVFLILQCQYLIYLK